jgi:hypothetical protein
MRSRAFHSPAVRGDEMCRPPDWRVPSLIFLLAAKE